MIDPHNPSREEADFILAQADEIASSVGRSGLESRAEHLRMLARNPDMRTNGQLSIAFAVFNRHVGMEWLLCRTEEQGKELAKWAKDLMDELLTLLRANRENSHA